MIAKHEIFVPCLYCIIKIDIFLVKGIKNRKRKKDRHFKKHFRFNHYCPPYVIEYMNVKSFIATCLQTWDNESLVLKYISKMNLIKFMNIMGVIICQNMLTNGLERQNAMDDTDVCTILLQNFASASAEFMFCSISNARPIHMCTSCVDSYGSVVDGHSKIFVMDENENKTCRDELINLDRLAIIEAGYTYITGLWLKANCRNCFLQNQNSTVPLQLSNETKEFQRLQSDLNDCLESNYNESSKQYSKEVCNICSSKYFEMNKFYGNLKKDLNDLLCMDIVDSMNVTQNLWSYTLNCGETRMMIEWPLIASTATVLLIPVIFYIFAWKFTKTTPSAVSYQKRLSERIREKWRSRTGSIASQIRFS